MVAFDYDPLAHGYIKTLARPAGNVTGLFVQQIKLARLELMREVFPKAQAATVLWDKLSFDQWEAVEKAAKTPGIRVIGIRLHEQPYEYERALADVPIEATPSRLRAQASNGHHVCSPGDDRGWGPMSLGSLHESALSVRHLEH
jgi:hypothetical protein